MSELIKKIHCPYHDDYTESMGVYSDGHAYCFGCGKYVKSDVKIDLTTVRPKENLEEKLEYIKSLPKKEIRGVLLHYDQKGYYIIWPGDNFYKIRYWENGQDYQSRYGTPTGHTPPPFWVKKTGNKKLLAIEGEINALTAQEITPPEFDILGLSGVGKLQAKQPSKYLTEFLNYDMIYLMLDADAAGAIAAIRFTENIKKLGGVSSIGIILVKSDLNEIYLKYGKEEAKKDLCQKIGLNLESGIKRE